MRAPRVVVLGSAHVDLIASAPRLPAPGSSVLGERFVVAPGGKAANQAAQIARCGTRTTLISRLGNDAHGALMREALLGAGVSVEHIAADLDAPTGASVVLAANADYSSIIVPGAAGRLSQLDIAAATAVLQSADALLLQLEVPVGVSAVAAEVAAKAGVPVILNAAPARGAWSALPATLREAVSTLVVNQTEATQLLSDDPARRSSEPADLCHGLHRATGASILLTLGAGGAMFWSDGALAQEPAFPVEIVDAVGAGDAFLGAWLTAQLGGASAEEALRRGAAAGAIAVTRRGAFDAQPDAAEIEAFLASA